MLGNSGVDERLVASQEGLDFMELVNFVYGPSRRISPLVSAISFSGDRQALFLMHVRPT
jgi:hypothetical protein